MHGNIKFVDAKTGQWGFIVRQDGGPDVHFSVGDFLADPPWIDDKGAEVAFEIEGQERQRAVQIIPTLSPGPMQPFRLPGNPGRAFPNWASVPQTPFVHRDGRRYTSVYQLLAHTALDERWHFGDDSGVGAFEYPILRNYIVYTFYRLQSTNRISVSSRDDEAWAAFNTGLVDALYDPIFALFRRNILFGTAPVALL